MLVTRTVVYVSVGRKEVDASSGIGIETTNNFPFLFHHFRTSIHKAAYSAIRNTVSPSALVLPTTIIHDCFVEPLSDWKSTYANSFWKNGSYAIDTHRYHAWAPESKLSSQEAHIQYACNLASEFLPVQTNNFPILVGEWALSLKACATKSCTFETMSQSVNSQNTQAMNLFYRRFFEAQVTTYEASTGGWIYWNWKTQSSAAWSYQASLAQGWIPSDPTTRVFAQSNGCPTSTLIGSPKFATTSS
jgi:glucan 1,3-beta-glucosidase